jgi:hypothetical protein
LIQVLDKSTAKVFRANTQDVGLERHFLSPMPEAQFIEAWLGQVEARMAGVCDRLVRAESADSLGDSERADISLFMATMLVRTREMRETSRDVAEAMGNAVAKKMGMTDWVFKITEDGALGLQLSAFKDIPTFAAILSTLGLVLFVNETESPFTTSDHPVTRYNMLPGRPGRGGRLGLASPGIELNLPISPRLGLTLYDQRVYGTLPTTSFIIDAEEVAHDRWLQLEQSFRHVFSATSDTFARELVMLRQNPSVGQLRRQRVSIG